MWRVLFILFIIGCTNNPNIVRDFVVDQEFPIEEIKEVELLHTENGQIKAKIIANTIKRFTDKQPQLIFSDNLVVTFYTDSSVIQSILKAENAFVYEQKKIMIASDSVVLEGNNNRLETEELIWDEKSNMIYTNKEIRITTDKEVVFGKGFKSNTDFSEYTISKIHGTFNFDSE